MKIIIFAGGVGKRLWPVSREDSPKQFKALFGEETTLENSFNTISKKFNTSDIYISTGKTYVDDVYKAIPDLPAENIIVEPESRDTGAAVAYAMLKISQKFPDEPTVIRWQNSLIKDTEAFVGALDEADKIFENKEADLVYLGVPSRFPNTGVGHIKLGKKLKDLEKAVALYKFDGFVEKPDKEKAEKYHSEGIYAWNPGCYITTPRFILQKLEEKSPELYSHINEIKVALGKRNEWEVTQREFKQIQKVSIDYALWEKLHDENIKVVLAEYDWHYVSTWADLKSALSQTIDENIIKGNVKVINSKDCLIYNYSDKRMIAAIGLEGIEIVDTGDAILICNKSNAGMVKDLVNDLSSDNKLNKYI